MQSAEFLEKLTYAGYKITYGKEHISHYIINFNVPTMILERGGLKVAVHSYGKVYVAAMDDLKRFEFFCDFNSLTFQGFLSAGTVRVDAAELLDILCSYTEWDKFDYLVQNIIIRNALGAME